MSVIILLIILMALLALERLIYGLSWPSGLNADVRFGQDRAIEGDTVELIETLEYTGRLPLPWVRLKFQMSRDIIIPDSPNAIVTDYYNREELFTVGKLEKITRTLPALCAKRGQHRIVGVDAVSSDMLLTRKLVTGFGGDPGITVYPRRTEIPDILSAVHQMMGENIVRQARMEDPFMFRGVRDYIPGDQLSHINWKASARSDQLAVNQFERTSELCVSVWLGIEDINNWRDHELCEECIRIAATLVGTFIDDGIPVALCCNAMDSATERITLIGHGSSQEHKDYCLTALARLDLNRDAMPLPEFVDRIPATTGSSELVIVVSSVTGAELCGKVKNVTTGRDLFWVAPVRIDETQPPVGLDVIKNRCVWRVDCER